jgi:hypothetical protein
MLGTGLAQYDRFSVCRIEALVPLDATAQRSGRQMVFDGVSIQ